MTWGWDCLVGLAGHLGCLDNVAVTHYKRPHDAQNYMEWKPREEQWNEVVPAWLLANMRHWSHNFLRFAGRGRVQISRCTLVQVASFSSPLARKSQGRSLRAALQQTTEPDVDVPPPSPAPAVHGASEAPTGSSWRTASANRGGSSGLIEWVYKKDKQKGFVIRVCARWILPLQWKGIQT